ncbi:MAG: hypothetical protein K2N87_16100 [Eubacterium sp.]|nr:hypothetical protein [Eubacterium sp.]
MGSSIRLLDCTLRDGAYITGSRFGDAAITGMIKKMQDAKVDIIECGWLKDADYEKGTTFFHVPQDVEQYLDKKDDILYCVMIDWDRYDTNKLPDYDGNSIHAVRVVFPRGKHKEGIQAGSRIREKGYQVLFQAADTLSYSEDEIKELAECMNKFRPLSVSVVDTFGAMYFEDLDRICHVLDRELDKDIEIGFHAHNNQQMAFALSIHFIEMLRDRRNIIVDAALSGMGRGAGNTTTELMTAYLNRKQHGNYDLNAVMDAIDIYMQQFHECYTWGYSTPYFIAGMYQCHVNNIAYLKTNHRTNARDMRNIIESLLPEDRKKYDYDLLESKYIENQNRIVDDEETLDRLKKTLDNRKVLLIAPGKSAVDRYMCAKKFIEKENPVTIAVNAFNRMYRCDYIFFINSARYEYAKNTYPELFKSTKKILLSNIKMDSEEDEMVINFNLVVKRGWEHFDNAVINCLRLLNKLGTKEVSIIGFDGFKTKYNESYADVSLPTLNPENKWNDLNREIRDMYRDFCESARETMKITFLSPSIYEIGDTTKMDHKNQAIKIQSQLYGYSVKFVPELEQVLPYFREKTVYVIDTNIYRLYTHLFRKIPKEYIYLMEAVEEMKNMDTVMDIILFWKSLSVGKDWKAVCFGGGITQDVVTAASNLYLRNIDWYFFPTTLLAMCDSCIGGKCGINLGEYKNQIGVFYPPKEIYIHTDFLNTLKECDYLNGWGEILKFALTSDSEFYEKVRNEKFYIPCKNISNYIQRGLLVKKAIIEEDEFESDRRRILNYGHTFGHALEAYTHYGVPHGMGVIWGIDAVNYIAWKEGMIQEDYYYDIKHLIRSAFLTEEIKINEPDVLFDMIKKDKKVRGGTIHLAMLDGMSHLIVYPMKIDGRLHELFFNFLVETHDYYMH